MKYFVVWNVFNTKKGCYEYIPKEMKIWDILTNKVLTYWSWKRIWKNGSFSKEKCDRLCKKMDGFI